MRRCAMFKIGLAALSAVLLTSASAKAFDNVAGVNAATAFGEFGLGGLAVAGQAPATFEYPSFFPSFYPSFGQSVYTPVTPPMYTPVCWTQYVTIANGNTLVNFPRTICR